MCQYLFRDFILSKLFTDVYVYLCDLRKGASVASGCVMGEGCGGGRWAHASVLLRMVACETQDFASLLWFACELQNTFTVDNNDGVSQ